MKRYTIAIGDKTYNIGLQQEGGNQYRVLASGKVYELKVLAQEETDSVIPAIEIIEAEKEKPALAHKAPELLPRSPNSAPPELPAAEALPIELRAPMPGVIIEISVPPGAQVARGEQLLVLEAMKMKNPIRSPRDGIVDKIVVQAGQSVNYDDLLLSFREG